MRPGMTINGEKLCCRACVTSPNEWVDVYTSALAISRLHIGVRDITYSKSPRSCCRSHSTLGYITRNMIVACLTELQFPLQHTSDSKKGINWINRICLCARVCVYNCIGPYHSKSYSHDKQNEWLMHELTNITNSSWMSIFQLKLNIFQNGIWKNSHKRFNEELAT